jgi:hypothetical protein
VIDIGNGDGRSYLKRLPSTARSSPVRSSRRRRRTPPSRDCQTPGTKVILKYIWQKTAFLLKYCYVIYEKVIIKINHEIGFRGKTAKTVIITLISEAVFKKNSS